MVIPPTGGWGKPHVRICCPVSWVSGVRNVDSPNSGDRLVTCPDSLSDGPTEHARIIPHRLPDRGKGHIVQLFLDMDRLARPDFGFPRLYPSEPEQWFRALCDVVPRDRAVWRGHVRVQSQLKIGSWGQDPLGD